MMIYQSILAKNMGCGNMMKIGSCNGLFCDAQYYFGGTLEDLINSKGQFFRIGETPTDQCDICKRITKEFDFK